MKLRYYLRGLGIGILMTVVILTIAGAGNDTMTDEEIKARAKELGMVENTVLSGMHTPAPSAEPVDTENTAETEDAETTESSAKPDATATPEPSIEPEDTVTPKPSEEPGTTASPEPSEEPEATVSPEPSEKPEETVTPEPSTVPEDTEEHTGETITIVISAGDSSMSVSKDLEAAGLVESASAYDKYLCDNGYDRKIRTGTYKIPVGASKEEIALMITGRN